MVMLACQVQNVKLPNNLHLITNPKKKEVPTHAYTTLYDMLINK